MYSLNDTPIFFEFLKRFCKLANIEFKNKKIQNGLFLHSKCNCGQKDCATLYLKFKKSFKNQIQELNLFYTKGKDKILGIKDFNTNKGYIILHIFRNGFFEFEALCYKKFPYKKEIDKFFNKKRKIDKKIPKLKKSTKRLSAKNIKKLDNYFKDLEFK
ncbi:hypothetical protein CRU92_04565 [Arcobacter sp. FW59]|nr:hypothetical protein CRU92_04565 [Arcobacter sp. FW59]